MVLVLYAEDGHALARVESALPPERPALVAREWPQVERAVPTATCSLLLIEWLHASRAVPCLGAFRERHPHHPLILITRWDPGNARRLKDLAVDEVVWLREVEQELPTAVLRSCTGDFHFLRCLAVPFDEARHLPPRLRAALAYVCRSDVPVRSVKQLAAAVGCDRRTLWHQWNAAVDGSSSLRLQDFLHWVLLLRALGGKVPGRAWADVAQEVGIHPHTLGRMARQLAGRTLRELAENREDVVVLFRRGVLEFLLDGCRLDIV